MFPAFKVLAVFAFSASLVAGQVCNSPDIDVSFREDSDCPSAGDRCCFLEVSRLSSMLLELLQLFVWILTIWLS